MCMCTYFIINISFTTYVLSVLLQCEEKLKKGLQEIDSLKEASKDLDVRPDSEGYQDLMLAFDLQASLVSSESTLISALSREESRGAHQRSDFPILDPSYKFNCSISMDENQNLKISKLPLKELNEEQKTIIENAKREEDIRDKLLE